MPPLVRDLLALPDHVSKGDFVQSLAESLRNPERAVANYAVTEELVENFREALKVVAGALANGRSQPVFLHGSFGSGKSHFMAVLHLLLAGHPAPWAKPELHAVREVYEPLKGKRLLQLHFHMLGATSLESQVFGRYVEHVRDQHPEAPLPSLFRDQEVFDNATRLREAMGDGAFFGALNQGRAAIPGFGSLGGADPWTAERFDRALASPDAEARRELLTDLTRTLLSAFAGQTDRFVDVDEGLAEMSRHGAALGYHGIVLYLDELILWLASLSADLPFVQREINKLVKLKEAQDESREIPIVSFIARQRDLSELFGEGGVGAERALIEETFAHHASRFHTIELTDSNLRAIVPHRVVVARTSEDRERLLDGFEAMWSGAAKARDTLQAGTADKDAFRQVYPFSPALIDALVALSDRLQRDRTAIRILVEMLVEHLPELELGQIVPVGDVFDLVISADDAVDGPSKVAFQRARELYLHELLPRIQERHQTTGPAACQRRRPGHPVRIGCSGCGVKACRDDNRLVKTLLLAALVPRARPFDALTAKRLVHLNHGSVQAPVEAMAISLAATRLRDLARDVHALKIGDDADPAVSVSLQSIDLKPILQRAADQDTRPRRRFVLRKVLWDQLGLGVQDNQVVHAVDHKHVRRPGTVRFANVRTLRRDELVCPPNAEWHVVIDYPFDDEGYTPQDDERRVEEVRTELGGTATSTIAWLPTFFSRSIEDDLGSLARLDYILDAHNLKDFLSHLPPDEHARARTDLETLQAHKLRELKVALNKAYGLQRVLDNDPHLDPNRDVQQHVLTLDESVDAHAPRAATLAEGLAYLAIQLLEARYPRRPEFHAPPTPARLQRVREFLEKQLESGEEMVEASRQERDELQKVAEPLYLCRVHDQRVERLDRVYDHVEQRREQAGIQDPTLGQVRGWLDPDGLMGLPEPVANLVAWLWAVKQRRVATDGRSTVPWPANGKMSEHVVFAKPDLPDEATWTRAVERAALLGITVRGRALNARNVSELAAELAKLAGRGQVVASRELPARLSARLEGASSRRLSTACAVGSLLASAEAASPRQRLEAVAATDVSGTSPVAIGRSFQTAPEVVKALDGSSWALFDLVRQKLDDDRYQARAKSLLDRVTALVSEDELVVPLEAGLRPLVDEARRLLGPTAGPEGWKKAWEQRRSVTGREALAALDGLREELERQLGATDTEARVLIELVLEKKER